MKFDELVIGILLIVVGAIPAVPQVVSGGVWGWQPTFGAILMALGALVIASWALQKAKVTS